MLLEAPIIENIQIKQEIIINKPHVKSKLEEYCYEKLLTKYTVIRQYKEKRYPFKCDFYIPELDLFIELNAFEGHGFHPYNPKNKLDKEKLKIWEEKSKGLKPNGQPKTRYNSYIYVWTTMDPNKREYAKKNKLNYLEFFNKQEFDNWFNRQK